MFADPRRFLVVGAGGIGGIVAAHLLEQGLDVTTLTTNHAIRDAINTHGFRLRGETSASVVRGRAVDRLDEAVPKFDYVLLATQPPQLREAAAGALSALAPGGLLVCFQNGLAEELVGSLAGEDRVVGAIVSWGASMLDPGVYDRTSAGGFQVGTLSGKSDERVAFLGRSLEAIGPVTFTSNLRGARWSKLAINCAISSLGTVGGDRLGSLMRKRFVRRLALELMTETTRVAQASGVRLEKVAGTIDLEWIALSDDELKSSASPGLVAKHALLLAVGARYRRLRSSMLNAIERGRPPSVEFLNGEVVTRGERLGVPTPVNRAIRDEVLAIASRRRAPSHETLRAFFESTRAG